MLAAAAAAAALPAPAAAARKSPAMDGARTYVEARAAAMRGDHERAASLLAALAAADGDAALIRRALGQAISAGDMRLALSLARRLPQRELTVDGRLLLAADELRNRRNERALAFLGGTGEEGDLSFVAPLIQAWTAAERGDLAGALAIIDRVPADSLLAAFKPENRALILLKFRRSEEAEPFAGRAIENAGGRESRLRLAFADAFLAAGDRTRALAMIEGLGLERGVARARILAGKPSGQTIASAQQAFSELLLGLAIELNRVSDTLLPIGMAQVARYADPRNSGATLLLALLLDANDRSREALRVLEQVPAGDARVAQARDAAARILNDQKRFKEALALAQRAVRDPGAGIADWARLGDVFRAMDRHDDAADAYGRAVMLATAEGLTSELWPLHLLRASALESGNRWAEAKGALHAALAVAPEQPLVLNFLGYAKLERGEDLDVAEAMIRKASRLAPDDASITDSLGWALYKRGRLQQAIEVLQRAAAADPQQAEIHEHLGDALFAAGRRFEARFAWAAALITAEEKIASRVKAKIETGLTPATAAP
ncbi:MAG TPA: tetratricopeptide repeat protein [Sphingomicrobium sp.]|nr:tetratricopeptide repeat protein [Sphingomicrobium sp.]